MFDLRRSRIAALVLGISTLCAIEASAEPVSDQLLSGATAFDRNGCAIVRVTFNQRIQYLSHFPPTAGDELRIQLKAMDRVSGDRRPLGAREGVRAPASDMANIHAIELEASGATETLIVYFKRNVAARVIQAIDFRSIVFSVSKPEAAGKCDAVLEAAAREPSALPSSPLRGTALPSKRPPDAAPAAADELDRIWGEARAAYDKQNFDRAVQLLTKVVEAGTTRYHQEALELLGRAREQRGQVAHARAEYHEYLRLFPTGPGAERLRERLATLEAAKPADGGAAGGVAKDAAAAGGTKLVLGDNAATAPASASGNGTHLAQQAPPPEWTFNAFGSASLYYNLNQGGRGFIETPRTNVGWDKENPYKTYQNSVLGNLDYDARFENSGYAGRMRFSASQQNDFAVGTTPETRISTLYFDGRIKDTPASARIGRQTSTSGGVLGRYDGALASYKVTDTIAVNGVAGSPVTKASYEPFREAEYFYGASTDVSWLDKAFDTTFYVIEQRKEDLVDRRAVGIEGRRAKDGMAAFTALEYDMHFMELNSAVFSGSTIFTDRSTASINFDYRRAPILLVSNALQGQGTFKVSELLQRFNSADIDQLALDRTAESFTVTLAHSRPITDWLQWNGDFTVNRLGGMPASGGIDAVASPGTDYFLASQLIASGLIREGDTVTTGLRYANATNADRYLVELGMSYPLTKDWRVAPSLQLGYMTYKTEDRQDYQLLPTVRSFYKIFDDTMFELELGGKLVQSNSAMLGKELQQELLVLAGIRYDFSHRR